MIRIPQHRTDGKLNDLKSFIIDLESIQRQVDYWQVNIDECMGEGSLAFEELTSETTRLSYRAFESLCYCIQQTIDGTFMGYVGETLLIKLEAIDSSFWEISGSEDMEKLFVEKYGEYNA